MKDGNYSYATGGEIRFLKAIKGNDPKSASLDETECVIELDEIESENDITISYKLNDGGMLKSFTADGNAVDENYYRFENNAVVLSKYYFTDCVFKEGSYSIDFKLEFLIGDDAVYIVNVGQAERHRVYFADTDTASVKVFSNGKAIASGDEAKRGADLSFEISVKNGYKVKNISLEPLSTVYDVNKVLADEFTVTASSVYSSNPVSNMTDGKENTYWHSYYEVSNGSAVNPATPPHSVTLTFNEKQDGIGKLTYLPRQDNDGGRIIDYRIWASYDGESFQDEPVASGRKQNSPDLCEFVFDAPLNGVKALKLEAVTTSGGTFCHIAEIAAYTYTARKSTYKEVSAGTVQTVISLDDLFSDVRLKVETEKLTEGTAEVSYVLSELKKEASAYRAEIGKDFTVKLSPENGLYVPYSVDVSVSGKRLKQDADYTYVRSDNENAVLTVKNVSGDLVITASGIDHDLYKVSYADEYGATGSLPEECYIRAGQTVTVSNVKLKLAGYTFLGWSLDGKVLTAGDKVTVPNHDIVFKSAWKTKESGGGGTGSGKPSSGGAPTSFATAESSYKVYIVGTGYVTVSKGEKIENPNEIEGFVFKGWYIDEALTVPYKNSGVNEALILYPSYEKVRAKGDFTDVSGHWAEEFIYELYMLNAVNGYGDGTFLPDRAISRAEFLSLLYKLFGYKTNTNTAFSDVSGDEWYAEAVSWAAESKISEGTGDGAFLPDREITREEMAAMCCRAAECLNKAEEKGTVTFSDWDDVSSWAEEYILAAERRGVMSGNPDGSFAPKKSASRSEAVTVILRLMNLTK